MGDSLLITILPALVALTIKGALFWYAMSRRHHNRASTLFLSFLGVLSALNLTEIAGFHTLINEHTVPVAMGYLYYLLLLAALTILVHLTVRLALERIPLRLLQTIYAAAVLIAALILGSDWLITGFERHAYGIVRTPGPLYIGIEIYVLAIFILILGLLIYGSIRHSSRYQRLRNQWMLAAIIPMLVVIGTTLVLLHLGNSPMTSNVIGPVAISYFLIVASYATHHHRLFDITFFVPWSRLRKRQTHFYQRIRQLVAEIANLKSVDEIVAHLAECFSCPVALINDKRVIASPVAGARLMGQIPRDLISTVRQIVITEELRAANIEMATPLRQYGIGAVVPFSSPSNRTEGWLLFGNDFADHVYSARDFDKVEDFFSTLADGLLDQQLESHARINELERMLASTQAHTETQQAELDRLQATLDKQTDLIVRLQRQLPAGMAAQPERIANDFPFAPAISYIGKDRHLRKALKTSLPQTNDFSGPNATAFKAAPVPDVLICDAGHVGIRGCEKIARLSQANRERMILLIVSNTNTSLAAHYREELAGSLTELLPPAANSDYILGRIHALLRLREQIATIDGSTALIAASPVYRDFLHQLRCDAEAGRPLALAAHSPAERHALVHYLHKQCFAHLQLRMLSPAALAAEPTLIDTTTLVHLTGIGADDQPRLHATLQMLMQSGTSFILSMEPALLSQLDLPQELATSIAPYLNERSVDVSYMLQYFLLQHNLRHQRNDYLTTSDMEGLLQNTTINDEIELRLAALKWLNSHNESDALAQTSVTVDETLSSQQSKTLNTYLAEAEIAILRQTLDKCGGNHSKAASMLGLKPNTFHYKLKRFGLLGAADKD